MSINTVVSAYVSNWLTQHDKSYSWLANELAVSKSLVQHMINGNRSFTPERIVQVADVLGVSVDELISNKSETKEYTVQLRGKVSTREGESALQNVIFSCLKDDELYYANEIFNKGIQG